MKYNKRNQMREPGYKMKQKVTTKKKRYDEIRKKDKLEKQMRRPKERMR